MRETPTHLTVISYADSVGLRLHTDNIELRLTHVDAARISRDIDSQISARGHASDITIHLDETKALILDTPTAKRLAIELADATGTTSATPRRKTAKERAFIDDTIALNRARTKVTAVRIARKMIDDGQDVDAVLERLWLSAHGRGFDAGVHDALD